MYSTKTVNLKKKKFKFCTRFKVNLHMSSMVIKQEISKLSHNNHNFLKKKKTFDKILMSLMNKINPEG